MQSLLDDFIQIKHVKKKVPLCFYLDFSLLKPYPTKNAVFYTEVPEDLEYNYEYTINWKEYNAKLKIYGNFNKHDEIANLNMIEKYNITEKHFLLSQLQKAVRRKNVNISVQTTNEMFRIDIEALLRRLPIIVLEDGVLHRSFSTLIWFMVAIGDSNFQIRKNHLKWLLGLSEMACNITVRYDVGHDIIPNFKLEEYKKRLNKLTEDEYSNLHAILLRRSYGGMKGDMSYLLNCFLYYMDLFEKKTMHDDYKQEIVSINLDVAKLKPKDYLHYAYDFHVNKNLPSYLNTSFPEYSPTYLKKLMWDFASGINYRKHININGDEIIAENNDEDEKVWNKVKGKYWSMTTYNVKNLL